MAPLDHHMTIEAEIDREGVLETIRGGGGVKRWHARPILGEQTVAAHTWGVMVLVDQLFPDRAHRMMRAVLYHDVVEKFTGDLPADAKWRDPRLKRLTDEVSEDIEKSLGVYYTLEPADKLALSIADKMEMLWFCVEQKRLGNVAMDVVFRRVLSWFRETMLHVLTPPEQKRVLDMLETVYDKYNQPREII